MCVPDTCTAEEIKQSMNDLFLMLYGYPSSINNSTQQTDVTFPEKQSQTLDWKAILMLFILAGLILMKVIGTIVESVIVWANWDIQDSWVSVWSIVTKEQEVLQQCNFLTWFLYCFGLPRNYRFIFVDWSTWYEELKFINGVMFFCIITIIMYTIFYSIDLYGTIIATQIGTYKNNYLTLLFFSPALSIEIFLLSLGFLRMIMMLEEYHTPEKAPNRILFTLKTLFRYVLWTWIPMVMVVAFGICLFRYIDNGPMYNYSYDEQVWNKWCEDHWWPNLLYL